MSGSFHKFTPFTTRNGGIACSRCHGIPSSYEHRVGSIDPSFVQAVEERVGMGCNAWDMVDPREIILAAIELAFEQEEEDE